MDDLGRGTFGDIKLGQNEDTGRLVALKMIAKTMKNDEPVLRECALLLGLHHPHVI